MHESGDKPILGKTEMWTGNEFPFYLASDHRLVADCGAVLRNSDSVFPNPTSAM